MPNWCSTDYKCVGDSKEVRELHDAIEKCIKMKKPFIENGFSDANRWIGCVINYLGGDWNQYHCRGTITDYNIDDGESMLTIYQETAWQEAEGFREFIEKRFPSITVYYKCEECGCELFCTNDKSGDFFPERFLLDAPDDFHYFDTLEEVAKYVSLIVGHEVDVEVNAVNAAVNDYAEEHEEDDLFYSFHAFEVVD